MKTTKHPFEGAWDVVRQEFRVRGEWEIENEYGPDDWSIGFLADCRCLGIYRPKDDRLAGVWSYDESTGIISVLYDGLLGKDTSKHVFDETPEGVYLYSYKDEYHIRPDRDVIIAHHARVRQKLVRLCSSGS